ncbi:MAG TPA: hypothetical protein VJT33_04045 [bacterium]|nr:hypothetical protein [bacterium]
MMEWQVRFEFAHALTFDRIEALYGPLGRYHASISGGDGYDTSGITMTVEAKTAADALDVAWNAVAAAERITPAVVRQFEVRPMPGPDPHPDSRASRMGRHACWTNVEERRVSFLLTTNAGEILITQIPANVCLHCGDQTFRWEVVSRLADFRRRIDAGTLRPPTKPQLSLDFGMVM